MTVEVLRYAASVDGRDGTPAGVVLHAEALRRPEQLAIAQAIGYPQTAFVRSAAKSTGADVVPIAHVRVFSARAEVTPSLETMLAVAIALAERDRPGDSILVTTSGAVPATSWTDGTRLCATLTMPVVATGRATRLPLSPYDDLEMI